MRTPFRWRLPISAASSRPRRSGILLGIASAAALVTGCSHAAPGLPAVASRPPAGAASGSAAVPAGWSLIATVKGTIPRFDAPGHKQDGTVSARWYGARSSLPVIGHRPGWYEVRLVTRPNGSTAWVRAADVTITATPYQIIVDLATRHLRLLRSGKLVMNALVAIGTKQDPTPAGHYFVAMFERSPSAGYGPFILVTSAHSTAISDWARSGDPVIGIHGPLGDAHLIGTGGAALSHGCIRLQVSDLSRLRQVPAGAPITIIA